MSNWRWRQRGKRRYWYARAYKNIPQPDGTIRRVEVERCAYTTSKSEAKRKIPEWDAEFAERERNPDKFRPQPKLIFADAVNAYLAADHSSRFFEKLLAELGETPIEDIDAILLHEVAEKLYPGAKPSTVNRQVWTPVVAAINYLARNNKCPPVSFQRPPGHDKRPRIDATALPADGWFERVTEHLNPRKRAFVWLVRLTGMRASEALNRTPRDVDAVKWTLSVPPWHKTGKPNLVKLPDPVIEALHEYDWRAERWLFGTRYLPNTLRDIRKACDKAGVEYHSSHFIGRHSFAAHILGEGKSLVFLKHAGRWESLKAVEHYAHLAQSEVDQTVLDMGNEWARKRARGEVVKLAPFKKAAGNAGSNAGST